MLNYEVFKEEVRKNVYDALSEKFAGCAVKIESVNKTNMNRDTIALRSEDKIIVSAAVYLDDMYDAYCDGQSIEAIVEHIIDIHMEHTKVISEFNTEKLLTEDKLFHCLINKEKNKTLLETVPHVDYLDDLAIICKAIVGTEDDGVFLTNITHKMIEKDGISENELFKRAKNGTVKNLPVEIERLSFAMWVITNESRLYGANAMLDSKIMKQLANEIGGSFYIIPSSVHEIIVVPTSMHELKGVQEALFEGNEGFVTPEEFLSDTVYMYDELIDAVVKAGA